MQYFERHQGGERALLVSLTLQHDKTNDIEEFRLLADSAGAVVVGELTANLNKPFAKLFVGTGKAQEIKALVDELDADLVLFNHTLSPSQERNLEALLQCRVVDRTGLILDIFAKRARTYEGKLQVELAQLSHLATRLVRGWTHLERQKGGIGLRGPGETQLETDRRLLQIRVGQLKAKLAKVKQTRQIGRSRRQKSDTPTISLVGYTNAGKSTLFNRLTDEHIYAADQLFATLDPTLRKIGWANLGDVVLADTVGFVKNLPHELVESFHATLEETLQADLLLHVIDVSSPQMADEMAAVDEVLAQIGANAPVLLVYNKIDKSDEDAAIYYDNPTTPKRVYLSAKTGAGMDCLTEAVSTLLGGVMQTYRLTLPTDQGGLINALYELNLIKEQHFNEQGQAVIDIYTSKDKLAALLGKYHLDPRTVLSETDATTLNPPKEAFEYASALV